MEHVGAGSGVAEEAPMKRLLCLVAILSAPCLVSCDHAAAVTPAPISVTSLAFTRASVAPQTVHVIPFFDYGKSGYEGVGGVGGDAGLIGNASVLYGTTVLGGDTKCLTRFNTGSNTGCGIVYRLVSDSSKPKYKIRGSPPLRGGAWRWGGVICDALRREERRSLRHDILRRSV